MRKDLSPETAAFLRRVTYGVLLGLFVIVCFVVGRTRTQADVDIEKARAQAQFAIFTAQQSEAERILTSQDRRVRCVVDLKNSLSWWSVARPDQFKELVADICK